MKIALIVMIFAICQTLSAQVADSGGDSLKSMMGQLKQLQEQQTPQPGPRSPTEASEERRDNDQSEADGSQSRTLAGQNVPSLSMQRKLELAEYACRGQSHGVPCSFSSGNGARISGVCYKANYPRGLFCKPSSYPSTPQVAPKGQPAPGK